MARRRKKRSTRSQPSGNGRRRRKGGRKSTLAKLSIADLHAEIDRRQEEVKPLIRERDELQDRIDKLDKEIEEMGGNVASTTKKKRRATGRRASNGRRRGRRARNKKSLVDMLEEVLRDRTLSVTDAAQAVQDQGYKTTSSNFRTIVNQALLTNPDKFKKVERGTYTAK